MKLTLINFRNVEYAELDLSGATILLGLNGQGKSTVHNAIQLALFGWCEHTTKAGAGYAALIRNGAPSARIVLDWRGYRVLLDLSPKKREWTCCDPETGEVHTDINSPAALWQALRINQTHAMVCAFPTQIVGGAEFSSVLSDYLRGGLTRDALMARVPAEHMAPLANLAAGHRMQLDTVADFEAVGGLAYAKRTDVNRDLKMADAAIKETGFIKPAVLPDGTVLTVADIARLGAERARHTAELNALRVELGRAYQAASAPVLDVQATETEINSQQAVLDAAEKALAAIQLHVQAQWDLNEARNAQHAAERAKQKAEAVRDAVATDCPTCKRKLTKPMRDAIVADAQLAVDAAAQVLASADAETTRLGVAWQSVEYKGDPADVVNARKRNAEQEIARLTRMLKDAAVPVYTGPSPEEIEATITAGVCAVDSIDTRLVTLNRQRELAECTAHAAALRADFAHLDWIVKEFHDGIAYRALLVEAAAPIVGAVNAWLVDALEIVAEGKSFGLLFNGRPLGLASAGQRALVAYAFANAFADCGAPILLDDINNLDPEARGRLAMRLRQTDVVLAGTPLDTSAEYLNRAAAALAPMRVLAVQGGTYREVAA